MTLMLSTKEHPMTATAETTLAQVASPDGTTIAVFISGQGRPLVAVHGTTSDHTTWRPLLPHLEPHVAVHAVDRRGRGASGDGPVYSLATEYADVAAVADAAAAATGSPVDLLGHSYGGLVAFGAATLTPNIRKLVLYEGWPAPAGTGFAVPPEIIDHLESLLTQGRPGQMLETFYRNTVLMPAQEISALKASPTWPARIAAASTIPRELRADGARTLDPARAAKITAPVLLLVGADSPQQIKANPGAIAAALPNATIRILPGQAHTAHLTSPQSFAQQVISFLRD
jgi:pimeloyl-ACP methyl ester carboxylesterase